MNVWFVLPSLRVRSLRVLSVMVVFSLSGLACHGTFQQPPGPCQSSADCPGSMLCTNGSCRFLTASNSETPSEATAETNTEPPPKESNTTETPPQEQTPEPRPESQPEPRPEPAPEEPPAPEPTADASEPSPDASEPQLERDEPRPEITEPRPEPRPEAVAEVRPEAACTTGARRPCYSATAGCRRSGSTYSCLGACKAGVQTCRNGQWETTCQGEVGPQTQELCSDTLDNDCDGVTNEGCPCDYQNKSTGVCNTARRDTRGTCLPPSDYSTTDKCDGKDNDCNGYVDDNFPEKAKACTIPGARGECARGQTACPAGSLICLAVNKPVTEVCRDRKDNDCDGYIDEICGVPTPHVLVAGSGKVQKGTGVSTVFRGGTGRYRITPNFPPFSCGTYPLLLTAHSTAPNPVQYTCSTTNFDVFTGSAGLLPNLQDVSFNAVIPPKVSGHVWGSVASGSCLSRSPYTCTQPHSWGGATVSRPTTGTYVIKSTSCNTLARPLFATIRASKIVGFATMQYSRSGECTVQTYNTQGVLANFDFSYWIPSNSSSPSIGMAWAVISSTGKLLASNTFSDRTARWSVSTTTSGSTTSRVSVSFPAWANPSAFLLGAQTLSPHTVSGEVGRSGVTIVPRLINGGKISIPRYISVMFLQ